MKRSRFTFTILIVLLILCFTFTTVAAGTPAGDDIKPPDITRFPVITDDYVPAGEIAINGINPYPVSPYDVNVTTRTPKFYFTSKSGASQYHIVLWDIVADPDKLVYDYYGTGTCGTGYCWLQPSTTLKTIRYNMTSGGIYTWQVEAMVGGVWKGLSSGAEFGVLSPGFTTTFDTDIKKWTALYGTWTRTTAGYYKTPGVYNQMASAMYNDLFLDNYVYEVTMKRKTEADSFNRIIFQGNPSSMDSQKSWGNGYYFGYYNSGSWGLWRREAGITTYLYNGVTVPFINPYSWNTLTVWTDYPNIYMWINGAYVGSISDDTFMAGWVGVGMFESFADLSPLSVDSATLYYSAVSPYAITDVQPGTPGTAAAAGSHEGMGE